MTPIRRIQPATDHLSAGTVDSRAGFFVPSGGSSAGRHFFHLLPRVVPRVNPTAGSVLRTVHAGDVGHRGCERADVKKTATLLWCLGSGLFHTTLPGAACQHDSVRWMAGGHRRHRGFSTTRVPQPYSPASAGAAGGILNKGETG